MFGFFNPVFPSENKEENNVDLEKDEENSAKIKWKKKERSLYSY